MEHLRLTLDEEAGRPDDGIELAKSEVLKAVAYALLREAYGVVEVRRPDFSRSINFSDEVRRFEVNLIQQALLFTNGRQREAARLLNLNATTLNTKIKLHRIDVRNFCRHGEETARGVTRPNEDD